ncbi:MAG: hypothetical protein HZB80_10050 [Deltaproteobacteria bacterium]|nr:hypothetical protein [Deltaproteobacteria bacterium]
MKKDKLPELISEIKDELELLKRVAADIGDARREMKGHPEMSEVYEESLALKLHNFYTGCERIFHTIADDMNGGASSSFEWHKRLLKSMSLAIEGKRPPVISKATEKELEEFLAFRHVIRNIYGFEIDSERLQRLLEKVKPVFESFKKDTMKFLGFLRGMAK